MLMSGLQYAQTKRVVEPNVLNLRCGVPLRLRSGQAQLARHHLDLERFGGHARLLAFVDGERTDRRTGTGVATGVGDLAAEKLAQSRLDETPGAHVLRFFLAPDKLGGLWIRFDIRPQLFFSEWIKLLNADDGRVVDLLHIAIVQKVIINFAGAQNDALYLFGRTDFRRTKNFFEGTTGELSRSGRGEMGA